MLTPRTTATSSLTDSPACSLGAMVLSSGGGAGEARAERVDRREPMRRASTPRRGTMHCQRAGCLSDLLDHGLRSEENAPDPSKDVGLWLGRRESLWSAYAHILSTPSSSSAT